MLEIVGHRCPLCGFALDAEELVGDDASPYAAAEPCGYWAMVGWVLSAGHRRLGYLGRMRRSRASGRFALFNLVLLALSSGLVVMPDLGWRMVTARSAQSPEVLPEPHDTGWWLAAKGPIPEHDLGRPVGVRLWMHPGQWLAALIVVPLLTFLLGAMILAIMRAGADHAMIPEERGQDRFGAAVHYSTAHVCILLAAALCYGTQVIHRFSQVQRWPVSWDHRLHLVPAFFLGVFGLLVAWFWLIRLAQTAPAASRGRLLRHFGLWTPILALLVLGGWMLGAYRGLEYIARASGTAF